MIVVYFRLWTRMIDCCIFQAVDESGPAYEAGIRPSDLITHVNSESVQGLLHTQVVQLILAGGNKLSLRSCPLDQTTIKTGGKKRTPGKMARRSTGKKTSRERTSSDKKRRTSLFRRLSNRKAEQHIASVSPLTQSKSFTGLNRSLSSNESLPGSPTRSPRSPPTSRIWSSPPDSPRSSSQSSSPSSSTPNSPAGSTQLGRPSSLHGLKHKLAQTLKSPHRRKSVHNIPLSPLARTPSPSSMATSPTRSPSPLTVVDRHHGASTLTAHSAHSNTLSAHSTHSSHASHTSHATHASHASHPLHHTPTLASKKSLTRPKSCEPGSPLSRRAMSPDRLHPASAERSHPVRKTSWQEKKDTFDHM